MKKVVYIGLCMVLLAGLVACGNSSKSGTSLVTITIGDDGHASIEAQAATLYVKLKLFLKELDISQADAAIPGNVETVRITVDAPDMKKIREQRNVVGLSSVSIPLQVPNGKKRHFRVECLNTSGIVVYLGETYLDLFGKPVKAAIDVLDLQALHVGVDQGSDVNGCGMPASPCRTITFALTQAVPNQTIYVASGTYSGASGETFPIQLLSGTRLKCLGTGYASIIDTVAATGTAIMGANNASVENCRILNLGNYSFLPGIDDNAANISLRDNLIEEGICRVIRLQADSLVTGNIIQNRDAGDCTSIVIEITGGQPSITNNDIINNFGHTGIDISAGLPTISGNTINSNDTGITIGGGSPTISGNTVKANLYSGIYMWGGTPRINNNIISCNTGHDFENQISAGLSINARNNMWDHSPPSLGCTQSGEDVCDAFMLVDYSGSSLAPSRCP